MTAFDLHSPHSELAVTGTSIVEAGTDLAGHDRVGWGALAAREVREQFGELLTPTPLTAMDDEVVAAARDAIGRRPHEAGALVCRFVSERMEYLSGSTNVKTNAMQAWTGARASARTSRTSPWACCGRSGCPPGTSPATCTRSPARIGEAVTGESHAWVEWWDGGWNGFDPTNSVEIGTRHVTIGRGRDYGDVPPFKGLFSGPRSEGHTVTRGGHPPRLTRTLPPSRLAASR